MGGCFAPLALLLLKKCYILGSRRNLLSLKLVLVGTQPKVTGLSVLSRNPNLDKLALYRAPTRDSNQGACTVTVPDITRALSVPAT